MEQEGYLPIVPVSREAKDEAVKPYIRNFDAYVDPEEDKVFISDPLFAMWIPRNVFMGSEHANVLTKVAFTSGIYTGLAQSSAPFPGLCDEPATILRRLRGLTHLTLGPSEDGAGISYSRDFLDHLGEDAMETMSKGCFRHLGNINLKSGSSRPLG